MQEGTNFSGHGISASRPQHQHEGAAAQWANAKSALVEAELAMAQAEKRLVDARENERAAWQNLEAIAGRGPQAPVDLPYVRGR